LADSFQRLGVQIGVVQTESQKFQTAFRNAGLGGGVPIINQGLSPLQALGNLNLRPTTGPPSKFAPEAPDEGTATAWDREIDRIERHTATLKADALAVGESAGAQARMRAEFTLLDAARKDDTRVTAEQRAEMQRLAIAVGNAQADVERAKIAFAIKFDRGTAFLTADDVAIAGKLKALYPDVATALRSAEAERSSPVS
jgi:hypothetical protein